MTRRGAAALLLGLLLGVSPAAPASGEEPGPGAPAQGAEASGAASRADAPGPAKRRKPHPRAPHAHDPHHGGQVGMWKDWHLEVAIPAPGDYRVYVTDAYREPLPADGLGGVVAVTPKGGTAVELALSRGTEAGCLVAVGEPVTGVLDVEVRIEGLSEKVFMEFHFEPGPGVAADPAGPEPAAPDVAPPGADKGP